VTPAALVPALLPVLLAASAAGGMAVAADEPASGGRLAGRLARLDLVGRCLVIRLDEPPPHERAACVDADTELRSDGRAVRFEDLRPGVRVSVDCRAGVAACTGLRVRVVGERPALGAETP